jgi:hypothetical protein
MEGMVPITLRGVMGVTGARRSGPCSLEAGTKREPASIAPTRWLRQLSFGVGAWGKLRHGIQAQATGGLPPMTVPSDTPDENEKRRQDCQAKAAYCKWVASISPDEKLRKVYTQLSEEWEKEATK